MKPFGRFAGTDGAALSHRREIAFALSCRCRSAYAEKEPIDFSAMCHELVEDAEILALRKKIATKSEILPAIAVYADESYLRRILLNLLDNAVKYNVEGGTVSISLGKSGLLAIFRIANTGPEVPREQENLSLNDFIGPTRVARPTQLVPDWG